MKRFAVILAVAAAFMSLTSDPSHAQFGWSNSSSWSNNYSSSWGSSQGFGPNGYFDNQFSNRRSEGTFTQGNGYTTPWGGGSRGTTQSWGAQESRVNNSGWNPASGFYNNQGGNFDAYNRGGTYNNRWRW